MMEADAEEPAGNGTRSAPAQTKHLVGAVGFTSMSFGLTSAVLARSLLIEEEFSQGQYTCVVAALSIGALVGQALLGDVADRRGRCHAMRCASGLLAVGSLGSSLSGLLIRNSGFMLGELVFFQFLLGMGVGGEYPSSASYLVECAIDRQTTGAAPSQVTSARVLPRTYIYLFFGKLLAPLVVVLCLSASLSSEATWRVTFLLSALGAAACLALRLRHRAEPHLFENQRANFGSNARMGLSLVFRSPKPLFRAVLGTSTARFLHGFLMGGLAIPALTALCTSQRQGRGAAEASLFLALASFPGFLVAFALWRLPRRTCQLAGFALSAVVLLALAAANGAKSSQLEIALLFILQAIDAAGAGAAVLFVPAEIFPTCLRASCLGLTGVAATLGLLAGWALLPAVAAASVPAALGLCAAAVCVAGLASWWLTPRYDAQVSKALASLQPGKDPRESTIEALERGASFRQCPSCEVMVEREGGCNVITCQNCSARWCFACGGKGCPAWACRAIEDDGPDLESFPRLLFPRSSERSSARLVDNQL